MKYRVYLPWVVRGSEIAESVVLLLSLLAPVYALYASRHTSTEGEDPGRWVKFPPFPPDFQAHEARLAALVEDEYGYSRLSNEVLFHPVPDLVPWSANFGLGEGCLIDFLFTHHRW